MQLGTGEERAGADLRTIADDAKQVAAILDGLHRRYSRDLIEQAAIDGALDATIYDDPEQPEAVAIRLAARLDSVAEETERGWVGSVSDDGGLVFERTIRGVREAAMIDPALIDSADARRLSSHHHRLGEVFATPAMLRRKDVETVVHGPRDLLHAVLAAGRKGVTMQRYKGLGEMNASQLWETTLDPDARTLLQVRIREGDEADALFSQLMGDDVEPRREFIQSNALNVANLDV